MEYSTNERAEKIVGKRIMKWLRLPIDQPAELWYTCPVCKNKNLIDWEYDERLTRSEYNWFLRCHECNKDYPTCLCCWDDIEKAINIYLDCINEIKWTT